MAQRSAEMEYEEQTPAGLTAPTNGGTDTSS